SQWQPQPDSVSCVTGVTNIGQDETTTFLSSPRGMISKTHPREIEDPAIFVYAGLLIRAWYLRAYFSSFTTWSWLSTLNTSGTPLARIPAMAISLSLSTTPVRVTWPLLTMMRMAWRPIGGSFVIPPAARAIDGMDRPRFEVYL